MNKQHNPKNVRPASTATPQANTEARLLDSDGNPKVVETSEAEVAQAEAHKATGLEIFKLFSFAVPEKGETATTGDGDSVNGMSFSKYAVMEARQAAQGDLANFISYCEDASKACGDAAKALITPHYDSFLEWAVGLVKGSGSIKMANGDKGSTLVLAEDEYSRSIKALVYSIGKVSNATFFGEKGQDGKAPKPAIFNNPSKVAKLAGFEGGNEKIKGKAIVNHVLVDKGDNVEYCLTQIAHLANHVNRHEAEKAGELWNRLTGKILNDQRIVLMPDHLRDWTQARMLGIMKSAFETAKREALQAKKLKSMTEADLMRLDEYRRNIRIAINKAEDTKDVTKPEKIAGSNVQSPDGRATLPTPTMTPKTLEDIQLNKIIKLAGRQAEAEMHEAITKGELDEGDLEACQAYWEAANARILTAISETPETTEETSDAETPESSN